MANFKKKLSQRRQSKFNRLNNEFTAMIEWLSENSCRDNKPKSKRIKLRELESYMRRPAWA